MSDIGLKIGAQKGYSHALGKKGVNFGRLLLTQMSFMRKKIQKFLERRFIGGLYHCTVKFPQKLWF